VKENKVLITFRIWRAEHHESKLSDKNDSFGSGFDFGKVSVPVPDSNPKPDSDQFQQFKDKYSFAFSILAAASRKLSSHF
jgi:hypothetical protein